VAGIADLVAQLTNLKGGNAAGVGVPSLAGPKGTSFEDYLDVYGKYLTPGANVSKLAADFKVAFEKPRLKATASRRPTLPTSPL
jgi:hypothetical protein